MCALFVEALMESIMESAMIPKAQVEREVSPILSMFLERVLTETLRDKSALSGHLVMICPEFPFRIENKEKPEYNHSTNIDWLMYNTEKKQLLFVELKTSDTSYTAEQNSIYLIKQEIVRNMGGSILLADLARIRDVSGESGKYQNILDNRVARYKTEISECHEARIVYLVPKSVEHKVKNVDIVHNFGMLSSSIMGPFAEEWRIIQKWLCMLDDSSNASRNQNTSHTEYLSTYENVNFEEMIRRCLEYRDGVVVGFTGGKAKFLGRTLADLRKRLYKVEIGGIKNANWLTGSSVIEMLKSHFGYQDNQT